MVNYYENLKESLIASGIPFEEAGWAHLFQTESEFNSAYTGENYHEPWVSYTVELSATSFNKETVPPGPTPVDYRSMPLTIEISAGTGDITFNRPAINYRINDGEWILDDNPTISVSSGDIIQVKQDHQEQSGSGSGSGSGSEPELFSTDDNLLYTIYGNIMSIYSEEGFENLVSFSGGETKVFYKLFNSCTGLTSAENLVLPATTLANYCYYSMFGGCTSLTTAPSLPATTLANNCYGYMFTGCTSLTTPPELPATTLAEWCYSYMFEGCTSLTTAPELPVTTLTNQCYIGMFRNCTSLAIAPELPATTLTQSCYYGMFYGCTSLTTAPVLPATTLTSYCYYIMFYGCTSLTTAPELPATTLAQYCYGSMFQNCTSLTTAPELPATTLTNQCYNGMFNGCTGLNYIKCLATDISATNCTSGWAYNVASSGTFVKDANMNDWTYGGGGIPSGWTVQDAS